MDRFCQLCRFDKPFNGWPFIFFPPLLALKDLSKDYDETSSKIYFANSLLQFLHVHFYDELEEEEKYV